MHLDSRPLPPLPKRFPYLHMKQSPVIGSCTDGEKEGGNSPALMLLFLARHCHLCVLSLFLSLSLFYSCARTRMHAHVHDRSTHTYMYRTPRRLREERYEVLPATAARCISPCAYACVWTCFPSCLGFRLSLSLSLLAPSTALPPPPTPLSHVAARRALAGARVLSILLLPPCCCNKALPFFFLGFPVGGCLCATLHRCCCVCGIHFYTAERHETGTRTHTHTSSSSSSSSTLPIGPSFPSPYCSSAENLLLVLLLLFWWSYHSLCLLWLWAASSCALAGWCVCAHYSARRRAHIQAW